MTFAVEILRREADRDETRKICDRGRLRADQTPPNAQTRDSPKDCKEYAGSGTASTHSGSTRWWPLRPGPRFASPRSMRGIGRRDDLWIPSSRPRITKTTVCGVKVAQDPQGLTFKVARVGRCVRRPIRY